jgi:hypothetical protein
LHVVLAEEVSENDNQSPAQVTVIKIKKKYAAWHFVLQNVQHKMMKYDAHLLLNTPKTTENRGASRRTA